MSAVNEEPMIKVINNELLLECIFSFCDESTLPNVRLVSQQWKKLSLKMWRKRAVIRFPCVQDLLRVKNADPEDVLQLRNVPFKRYVLNFNGDENEQWQTGREPGFLECKNIAEEISAFKPTDISIQWGPDWIDGFVELFSTLKSDALNSLEVCWSTFLETIPRNMPILDCGSVRSLTLHTSSLNANHASNRSLWKLLLRSCPNVEALSIKYDADGGYLENVDDRLEIVRFLRQARGNDTVHYAIKEFEMIEYHCNVFNGYLEEYCPKETEIMNTLAACNFPLVKLEILLTWQDSLIEKKLNLALLESCKETLQRLTCIVQLNTSCFQRMTGREGKKMIKSDNNNMVCLEALEELNVLNGIEWTMFFLAHIEVPRLKKLNVKNDDKDRFFHDSNGHFQINFSEDKVFNTLQTLVLEDYRPIFGNELIVTLVHLMPNLQHLTIPLDKWSFSTVCDNFNYLRTLHVLLAGEDCVDLDDEALTGMNPNMELENNTRLPNITNLKNLTEFSYPCETMLRKQTLKITEHSVIHGFLKLPKLFNLSIGILNLSDEKLVMLRRHVKGNLNLRMEVEPSRRPFSLCIKLKPTNEPNSELESESSADGEIEEMSGSDMSVSSSDTE